MATQPEKKQETEKKKPKTITALSKMKVLLPFIGNNHKSATIGKIFLVAGIIALLFSIYSGSQIMALVGLGLTFWAAVFFLVSPIRYVDSTILASTTATMYQAIDRTLSDYKYRGKGYYLPPYSQEEYLPENLKGLRETTAFISFSQDATMPAIDDIAQSKFLLVSKKGVLVTPPGLGLLIETEKNMPPTTKMGINDLFESISTIISERFGLAREIKLNAETERVNLKIHGSLYMDLYNPRVKLESIELLGCPITSAIACAIAKHVGRPVKIQQIKVFLEDQTTEVEYQIITG
ncbi:hypothetical protein E2P60_02155 [Candidatus Bathyarchaeota archaeon]|nr:hypothetical protein E2P60_02155 [Candidatus Bathyarchaeota archaeon]